MNDFTALPATAFQGEQCLASGPLAEVALAVKAADDTLPTLVFDDATGSVIDLDLRGTASDIVERLRQRSSPPTPPAAASPERGPGRPKLGVVAREVTLLPRHWDWLGAQPGGASPTLRRLIDDARKGDGQRGRTRAAQEAAYKFMSAVAGNFTGFEEASRALFAGNRAAFAERIQDWPPDIRAYLERFLDGPDTSDPALLR